MWAYPMIVIKAKLLIFTISPLEVFTEAKKPLELTPDASIYYLLQREKGISCHCIGQAVGILKGSSPLPIKYCTPTMELIIWWSGKLIIRWSGKQGIWTSAHTANKHTLSSTCVHQWEHSLTPGNVAGVSLMVNLVCVFIENLILS